MACQGCGIEAPTQQVLFVQHIGAVVMFFHKRISGQFCRDCVRKYFREYTVTTLFLGWWGVISIFATPVVLVINISNWLRARHLNASASQLIDKEVLELDALLNEIEKRDNRQLPQHEVAELEKLLKRRDFVRLLDKMNDLKLTRQDVVVRRILITIRRVGFNVATARQAAEMIAGKELTNAQWQEMRAVWERNF